MTTLNDLPTLVLAALVGTVAVARVTRLITADTFPPAEDTRVLLINFLGARGSYLQRWATLFECPFCVAPYVAAADLGWGYGSDLSVWWWLINLWAAGAYLAAMLVVRDEPPAED